MLREDKKMKWADVFNSAGEKTGEIHIGSHDVGPSPLRYLGYLLVLVVVIYVLKDELGIQIFSEWDNADINGKIYLIEQYAPVIAVPVISLVVTLIKRKHLLFFIVFSIFLLILFALISSIHQYGLSAEMISGWGEFLELYVMIIVAIAALLFVIRLLFHAFE